MSKGFIIIGILRNFEALVPTWAVRSTRPKHLLIS